MKKNKSMIVDLLLLGLTIALMLLFNVSFYPSKINDISGVSGSVSKKEMSEWVSDNNKGQHTRPASGQNSAQSAQIINEVVSQMNAGDLNAALESCNNAVKIDSTDAKSYYLRAVINTQLNRIPDAIKDYTLILKLNPDLFQAYLNRGILCMQEKQSLNAFIDFTSACKRNPLKSISFLLSYSFKSIF